MWLAPMTAALQFDQPVIDDLPVIDLPAHGDLSDTIIEVADMDSDPSGYRHLLVVATITTTTARPETAAQFRFRAWSLHPLTTP